MLYADALGFRSPLVLMKLGYDLRGTLQDTVEAPIPEALGSRANQIANQEPTYGELRWPPTLIEQLGDRPLM